MSHRTPSTSWILLFATTLIAIVAVPMQLASWLEAIAFVTGAICVALAVRESIWNFPIGISSSTLYGWIFLQSGLLTDAGLQVFFILLGGMGWWMWHHQNDKPPQPIQRLHPTEGFSLLAMVLLATIGLWGLVYQFQHWVSLFDALTTSISLACQWMLNRKKIENWLGWIFVDLIYIPLYAYKELYLTAVLYALFLGLAYLGWLHWNRLIRTASKDIAIDNAQTAN